MVERGAEEIHIGGSDRRWKERLGPTGDDQHRRIDSGGRLEPRSRDPARR
jgi:hypothetical protein